MDISSDKDLELDWKECYEWIKRCGLLKLKESIIYSNDSALYLMREMTDGILPLTILHILSNNQIDPSKYREYTSNPKESQFECVTNLKLFNKLAIKYFDINELEIVDPARIYSGRDFGKFILLLSRISKSEFAKKSGIIGFPTADHPINAEHEYYNQLEELAVKSNIYTRPRIDTDYNDKYPDEEKVYETLVQHKHPSTMDVPANKSAREMCISEIVESEKNYVESLQILIHGYKIPMESHLSQPEVETIFKYIENFYNIHKVFHMKITIAVLPSNVNVNAPKLHDIFIECKQSMLLYGNYCANMQIAQNLVQDMIKTNSYKRTQLEKCQESSNKFRKFALSDLLTLPMQRVLKYHLLLQTLLKWTPEIHEDYDGLKTAHEAMIDVARFVNDVKRDQEAIISIDKIQSEMTQIHLPKGKKLADYGRRQKDGELKVQLETDTKPKLRHVFIFDKMILLAKRKSDNYDFKNAFYLPDKYPEKTNIQPRKPEKVYPFKISIGLNKDNLSSIILFTKSDEMRQQWMDAVSSAIENQFPPGSKSNNYAFEMTSFSNYETCYFCKKLLSGTFYQGYQCRKTGIASHKACIPPPQSVSNRGSITRPESEPFISSNSQNNISQLGTHGDLFKETNGHRIIRSSDSDLSVSQNSSRHYQKQMSQQIAINIHHNNKPRASVDGLEFITKKTHRPLESGTRTDGPEDINYADSDCELIGPSRRVLTKPPMIRTTDDFDNELWYVGEMEREEANSLLQSTAPGTFMIRISKNHRRQGEYSLSIKDREPKHMKIQKNVIDNTFFLEDANKFNDLRDLVRHYSQHCLNEYFIKLEIVDLKLSIPMKRLLSPNVMYNAIAIESSPSIETQPNMLSFRKGDVIKILKDSPGNGWLCGSVNNVQGLVPSVFVRRESSS